MAISIVQGRALFTQKLLDVYQERIRPKSFIRSFFPDRFVPTKLVSIEVERGYEKVAVDVVRGSEGNFNRFSTNSLKVYEPPFFREYFTATDEDIYDRVLGSQASDNSQLFAQLLNTVADRLGTLQDMIERRKEIQCIQFLQTGQVTMQNGDTIDYARKAGSIVDLNLGSNGGYWFNNSKVFDQLQAGCKWLRTYGKVTGDTFILIFGEKAWQDFQNNDYVKERQNLFNYNPDQYVTPLMNAQGGFFLGTITAGPYRIQCWTYPEIYEDSSGNPADYIQTNLAILMPPKPRFHYAHCLVPQVVEPGQTVGPQTGPYILGEFLDTRKAKHDFDIQCAGVPVPVGVDMVYTMQVR